MKERLHHPNLRAAMSYIQGQRSQEVGGHTWEQTVERYGESYLFVEMAAIMSRLEQMIWVGQTLNPYSNPSSFNFERALDLCIDLGNYTDFLYQSLMKLQSKIDGEIDQIFDPE